MTISGSQREGQPSTAAISPSGHPATRRRRSAPLGSTAPPIRPSAAHEPAAAEENVGDRTKLQMAGAAHASKELQPRAIRRRRSRDAVPALAGNTEEAGRRRERRHGASDEQLQPVRRRSLAAIVQLLLGVCCWVAVGEVVYVTDPADPLARIAFFGAFFGALFFTLAPLLRGLTLHLSRSRLYQEASGRHAARQALLLAAFVILNAGMQAMRSWSALNALLLLGAFAVIEVVALARR